MPEFEEEEELLEEEEEGQASEMYEHHRTKRIMARICSGWINF